MSPRVQSGENKSGLKAIIALRADKAEESSSTTKSDSHESSREKCGKDLKEDF